MKRAMRFVPLMVAVSLPLCALAQDSAKKRTLSGDASSVLTQTECATTMAKVEAALFRVTGVNATLPRMASGSAPAKRTDILIRFDRIFELVRPKFKFTPRMVRFEPRNLAFSGSHPQRATLEKLIKWGCVSKTGSLATARVDSIKLGEFGDSIGLFLMRIADLTHRPNPKFSPYLGDGE